MRFFEFVWQDRNEVLRLTGEHVWLVVISLALAVAIAFPLGLVISRHRRWKTPVLSVTSIIETIPSLALFGLLLPLPWLGERATRLAVAALTLYALLPIIRNTYAGIMNVDPAVREAAVGMGLTDWQLLRHVEIPLALGTILAGIRVAAVLTIGIATIAAAIGAGGLGEFIFRGIAMVDNRVILAGAVPAALLALAADGLIGLFEKMASRRRHSRTAASKP